MQTQGMSESAQDSAFDSPCVTCNVTEKPKLCYDCVAFTRYVRKIHSEERRQRW